MDVAQVDNFWALAGVLGSAAITGIFGWLTLRAKGHSDERDEDAQKVMHEVENQENLRPVVNELVRQMVNVQEELAESRAIVKLKYPTSLAHIRAFHKKFPNSGLEIPEQIRDDL